MRSATYYILASLAGEPLHGYAIAKRAAELSDGAVTITAGTLYGALDRLTDQGLIVVDHEEVVNGRNRRYYRITDDGQHAMVAELASMRTAVAAGERAARSFTPGMAGA